MISKEFCEKLFPVVGDASVWSRRKSQLFLLSTQNILLIIIAFDLWILVLRNKNFRSYSIINKQKWWKIWEISIRATKYREKLWIYQSINSQ